MIQLTATSVNEAWVETFKALLEKGADTGNQKYLRDEVLLIEITNPQVIPADKRFPMPQAELDIINSYICNGEDEAHVTHEWTKLYRHRAFDEPNSQIKFLIEKLDPDNPVGEAQISMWDKNLDQERRVSPCVQIVWARIKHGKLELHVHANSSDAYKKLLMNMLEFISLQRYIAAQAGVPIGNYYHFLDSCHLHHKDKAHIERLYSELTS